MKIPASKVPAQVWADRARAHYGNLKKMEKDVLGYWEENKQVYRMNDALWDEMSIDEAEEFPMSLLDRLPYDCVFIQHRETIEIPFVFRGHELSGTVEREGYFCFRDAGGFHIAALNGQVDFMMGMDNTIAPIPITLEDYKSIGDCKDAAAIGTLAIAEEAKIEMAVETGIVAKDDSLEMASRLQMEAAGVSDMEKILGTLMYISSKEADVRTVYVPQKNQTRKSRQTDCTVHDVGFDSASRRSSGRCAASTSMRRRVRMAARPDGMWHPMSGAAIGTGTGPARGRTPPASKSSGSRRQS